MLSFSRAWLLPNFANGSLTPVDALNLLGWILGGYPIDRRTDVREYEKAVANLLGVRFVFVVGAARMGLYLLLKALEFAPGDEVIIPGYTCVVMPNATRHAGCKPVYVDIRTSDFNIDPSALEAAITGRTRAVLMQHTFGIPAAVDAIRSICRRHGLFLIEDGAHALGAAYAGKPVGHWGDAALFSTETSKMISTDKGGLLVLNDPILAARIRLLYEAMPIRSQATERMACLRVIYNVLSREPVSLGGRVRYRFARLFGWLGTRVTRSPVRSFPEFDDEEYESELDGRRFNNYPRRLSGILCRLGKLQIQRLRDDVRQRNRKAAYLAGVLPPLGATVPAFDRSKCYPSFVRYPFLVEDRPRWMKAIARVGLVSSNWLNDPLHPVETRCHGANGYRRGSCPNAEYVAGHILNLPVNRTVSLDRLQALHSLKI